MMTAGKLIAYQGTKGCFSEAAISELVQSSPLFVEKSFETEGFETLVELAEKCSQGQIDFGIIPQENSIVGTFLGNHDLLTDHSLFIVGECCIRESFCLVALPGTKIEEVTEILSHPFAFQQCQKFLNTVGKETFISQAKDTAGSAKNIKLNNLKTTAAIASEMAASLYGLEVLSRDIQDSQNNITRYLLVSNKQIKTERYMDPKTSLQFNLKNVVGSCFKALACFSLRDINITKMESRPSARTITLAHPWEYIMHLDIDGSVEDENVVAAFTHLKEFAENVTVLGAYPRHIPIKRTVSGMAYGVSM